MRFPVFETIGSTVCGTALVFNSASTVNADTYGTAGLTVSEVPMDADRVTIRSPDGTDEIEVSREMYEAIEETAEIKADADLMKIIKKSKRQAAKGETVSWKSLKAKLGL